MGFSWVLVLFATALTPYFMQKNICFGISIPVSEYNDPKIRLLRRKLLHQLSFNWFGFGNWKHDLLYLDAGRTGAMAPA